MLKLPFLTVDTPQQLEALAMIAAYLRQAELSLHRSKNVPELARFFKVHSMGPWVMLDYVQRFFKAVQPAETVDWDKVYRSTLSPVHIAKIKIALALGKEATTTFSPNEIAAILESLRALNGIASGVDEPSQERKNSTRLRLCYCSMLVEMRVNHRQVRQNIQMVEHLHAAEHMVTVPLPSIAHLPQVSSLEADTQLPVKVVFRAFLTRPGVDRTGGLAVCPANSIELHESKQDHTLPPWSSV